MPSSSVDTTKTCVSRGVGRGKKVKISNAVSVLGADNEFGKEAVVHISISMKLPQDALVFICSRVCTLEKQYSTQ